MSVASPVKVISRPEDRIRVQDGAEPKLQVQKVSTFLGFDGVYIIGKVTSGCISTDMVGQTNGRRFTISEIESKYPNCQVAKEGMTIGISAHGIGKEDIQEGVEVNFDSA